MKNHSGGLFLKSCLCSLWVIFPPPDLLRLLEWNAAEDVGSIIRLISGDWLWWVIIGWLGRGVIAGVISEVELKGTLPERWALYPEEGASLGSRGAGSCSGSWGRCKESRPLPFSLSLSRHNLLHHPATSSVLSEWSSPLFLHPPPVSPAFPLLSPALPTPLAPLAWLIMNEADHLSIPSSLC